MVVLHDALGREDGLSPDRAGKFLAGAGIADDVALVGAAGRLDTWKGFDVLLAAFPEVRRQRPAVELAVAGVRRGKESYAEGLAALANRTEGVHWLAAATDMAEFMADLDLFVLPSTEPEPFASAALEALASGLPLVATDHGGSPEMLGECPPGSGKLFRPRDTSALAQAVLAILPDGPTSTERRRARTGHLVGDPAAFPALFEEALAHGNSAGDHHTAAGAGTDRHEDVPVASFQHGTARHPASWLGIASHDARLGHRQPGFAGLAHGPPEGQRR